MLKTEVSTNNLKLKKWAPFLGGLAFIDKKRRISEVIDLNWDTGELTRILRKSLNCKLTVGLDSSPAP